MFMENRTLHLLYGSHMNQFTVRVKMLSDTLTFELTIHLGLLAYDGRTNQQYAAIVPLIMIQAYSVYQCSSSSRSSSKL